jgi:putative hydrolase of the HAD superfamily
MIDFNRITHIVFDADDTLWQNHVFYADLIAMFADHLALVCGKDAGSLVKEFYHLQGPAVTNYGYGTINFVPTLLKLFETNAPETVLPEHLRLGIDHFRMQMIDAEPPLYEGVAETLKQLREKGFKLLMLTKGNTWEQTRKIQNSAISALFEERILVDEKHDRIYDFVAQTFGLKPEQTLMVGNSPKSDVLPALACGWNAVWVDNGELWQFEEEDWGDADHFLHIQNLSDILQYI